MSPHLEASDDQPGAADACRIEELCSHGPASTSFNFPEETEPTALIPNPHSTLKSTGRPGQKGASPAMEAVRSLSSFPDQQRSRKHPRFAAHPGASTKEPERSRKEMLPGKANLNC